MSDEHTPQPLEQHDEAVWSDDGVTPVDAGEPWLDVPSEPGTAEPAALESPAAWEPEPATLPAGSRVVLVVSDGPSPLPPAIPVAMPDVMGEQQGAALLELQNLALAVEVLHDLSDRLPRGYVLDQHPAPGAGVQPGADAVILVSAGRSQIPKPDVMLPSVVGLEREAAVELVATADLIPRTVTDYDPVAPPGTIIAQLPNETSLATPLSKRGGRLWIAAVAVLAVIALIAGIVLYVNRPTPIPNFIGLTQSQAEEAVRLAGFTLGSVAASQTPNASDIGNVVAQAPNPGGTAPHGSAIRLVVAGGQLLVPVPNAVGMTQGAAVKALQDAGLLFSVSQVYSSNIPSGAVAAQAPIPGQKVPPATTVGLSVSMGVHTITVPNVVGQLQTTAETSLQSSGLGVATASNYDTITPVGQVMGQQPTVGTGVLPGTIVGLLVSKGPPPLGMTASPVPPVAGRSLSKAKSALKSANLKYLVVPRSGTGKAKDTVVAQLPDAGVIKPRSSIVILFVSDGK